jgi:hypothetical protein
MGAVDRDLIGALRSNFWPRRAQSRNEPVRSLEKSSVVTSRGVWRLPPWCCPSARVYRCSGARFRLCTSAAPTGRSAAGCALPSLHLGRANGSFRRRVRASPSAPRPRQQVALPAAADSHCAHRPSIALAGHVARTCRACSSSTASGSSTFIERIAGPGLARRLASSTAARQGSC